MTDPIKAKIQELVPEVMNYDCGRHREIDLECRDCVWNDCSLAVVLRAIGKSGAHWEIIDCKSADECVLKVALQYGIWNLSKNSWDDQSEETKSFIGAILGV